MKTLLCVLTLFVSGHTLAQQFDVKYSLDLPDTLSFHDVEWVDADSDGLPDVLAFALNAEGEAVIFGFRNDGNLQLQYSHHVSTGFREMAWLVTDLDGDNLMDVLISGTRNGQPMTSALINSGNASFSAHDIRPLAADVIRIADFNQDGFRELLLSGSRSGPFLHILEQQSSGWITAHDSIAIAASSVDVLDIDADNDLDFFVTGRNEAGAIVSDLFYNQEDFYFTRESISPALYGTTACADLDHDGRFDVLVAGKDADNRNHLMSLYNDGSGFMPDDTLTPVAAPEIFAADLNSDGVCDISLLGVGATGDTVNVVLTGQPILHTGVVTQAFGDREHDGDLDLLQLTRNSAGYGLRILENVTATKNLPPVKPAMPVVANIFDRLFMYWENSSDDRTPAHSITYDVSLHSTGQSLMIPDYDLISGQRLKAAHGNNGARNYVLIRTSAPGPVSFDIQAVDNALHAGPGSICKGSGGSGAGLCSAVETMSVQACRNERVTLGSGVDALWFSFSDGFLADTSNLVFDFQEPDTIFSLTPGEECAHIKVYTLTRGGTVLKKEEMAQTVCEGTVLRLGVEGGWAAVTWSSATHGFLTSEDSIVFAATAPDTIKVSVADDAGCGVERSTVLKISKPVIDVLHDTFQILKGESATLHVSGGSDYAWFPSTGLDDPQSSDPVASPSATTEYTVVVKDSTGCAASAHITVIVEATAFVPNLFTPNRDGSNDALKLYGLEQVSGFSFTIFDREGRKVYQTNSIADAVNSGWNGMSGGVDQPPGVYFWNVEGETPAGNRLQLNGKNSGSIVLLR